LTSYKNSDIIKPYEIKMSRADRKQIINSGTFTVGDYDDRTIKLFYPRK